MPCKRCRKYGFTKCAKHGSPLTVHMMPVDQGTSGRKELLVVVGVMLLSGILVALVSWYFGDAAR